MKLICNRVHHRTSHRVPAVWHGRPEVEVEIRIRQQDSFLECSNTLVISVIDRLEDGM